MFFIIILILAQTLGSITSPSSRGNVVGIRPTLGLVSRSLVIPMSEHQDAVGPIAKTVKDAAYVLQAIAGKDAYDNYTFNAKVPDYVAACDASSLEGKRIGVPRDGISRFPVDEYVLAAFEAALEAIRQAGGIVVDNTNYTLPAFSYADQDFILQADFATQIPEYLSQLTSNPAKIYNVADLRNATQTTFRVEEEYPFRDTRFWDETLARGARANNTTPEFWAAYQKRVTTYRRGGVPAVLAKYKLDALVLPADSANEVPVIIGTPIITVPMGSYGVGVEIQKVRGDLVFVAPNIP